MRVIMAKALGFLRLAGLGSFVPQDPEMEWEAADGMQWEAADDMEWE